MSEEIKENAQGELEQGEFKIKKKPGRPKKLNKDATVSKVDLSAKKEEKPQEEKEIVELNVDKKEETTTEETPVEKDEVTIEAVETPKVKEEKQEPVVETKETVYELPTDLKKVVDFMKDTGGTLNDYVRLNTDFDSVDENTLLREYYKSTKPHLDHDEISFIMEDRFSFDEEVDEERDIRKKKLAHKEEIAKAKNFLEQTKAKYYEEIKLKPSISQEQQKAMDFFNRYNEEQDVRKEKMEQFETATKEYFSKDFKGFEFNLGEKTFRYNVKNVDNVIKNQGKLQGLVGRFLSGEDNVDYKNYHKALYAAQNIDDIAKHFYEQGKTDATKDIVNKSKNIETASRPQNNEDIFINGFKVKAVSGVDSSKLKIKTRKK
tara:strand:+ start:22139 stop:23266 length:1128 start_codon:yes stop_codon:yes gene_type:complete